jgi:ribosomal protein S18 acetylase RimI-like enzyme
MESVALEPAATLSTAQLADLFTAGYEGYYVPFSVDEAGFRFMAGTWDFDLEASRVAVADGVPVGLCNLGVRGEEGWVGGVGVIACRRGEGIGEQLMRGVQDEARVRGLKRIWLEVLVQNDPAIRLYEKLGYRHVRELEVWSLGELVQGEHERRSTDVAAAQQRIRAARSEREPWQRADETVANLEDVEALESDRAAALFRRTGTRASLLQAVADDETAARELLQALPSAVTSVHWLNGPAGDPFNAAIATLGGAMAASQHELVLTL